MKLAKTDSFENYKSGFSAFKHWIEHVKSYITSEKKFEPYEVNLTLLYVLADARHAAFSYLEEEENNFQLKHHKTIVNNYKKEYEQLKALIDILPDFEESVDTWTNNTLTEQIQVIRNVAEIEKNTIELLEESLT